MSFGKISIYADERINALKNELIMAENIIKKENEKRSQRKLGPESKIFINYENNKARINGAMNELNGLKIFTGTDDLYGNFEG